jgi:hypothetical protein
MIGAEKAFAREACARTRPAPAVHPSVKRTLTVNDGQWMQVRDFSDQIRKLRNDAARLKFDLAHLAEQLTAPRAKTFTQQGLGRRMHTIERCVPNIFATYPSDRRDFLSHDECTDIGIEFQAFAMNVYALFDNVTWVCLLEARQNLAPKNIGLFKKACRYFIPPNLVAYLNEPETTRWFHEYGTLYRDSRLTAFRPTSRRALIRPKKGSAGKSLTTSRFAAG